ncbi:MAG: penicillin-binding protein activator [Deltaproteobacteria bacterium]|nr:MAG: penicillin-binding protein activator [Deltaproteobacteria bacterium]
MSWRASAAILSGFLLLSGCAALVGGDGPRASEEERRAYAAAVSQQADDPGAAERAFTEFLARFPSSVLADDASKRLGQIALDQGDEDLALRRFHQTLSNYPDSDSVDAVRIAIARLEHGRGNALAAAAMIKQARLSRLNVVEQREAFRLMLDVSDDPARKLRWLSRLRRAERDEDAVALVDVEIDTLIQKMEAIDLFRGAEQIGRQIPAGRALLQAADLSLDQGEIDRARRAIKLASKLPLDDLYQARLITVSERLRLRDEGLSFDAALPRIEDLADLGGADTAGAEGTLGVVLPLSGPFAHFGEESLRGVLLAAGIFGADDGTGPPDTRRVRVMIRDSAADPEQAARAVRELADLEVSAIIGPLLKEECEAAAAVAESESVPLLALTASEAVSAGRPHVFRVRTQPREEVALLVDYAVRELGAQRFAVLYPRDTYGRGLRRMFWEAVEEQGGRIVGVASYDPNAVDFAEPIRRLVGFVLLTSEEKQALEEREALERRARRLPAEEAAALRLVGQAMTGPNGELLPPVVDFDVLFIPESHEKVVLIAPQLAFHGAEQTRLMGTSGWHHSDLVKIAREHVEGAIFTTHFPVSSELLFVRSFTDGYRRAYSQEPDVFAAQAYDATNLVLLQLTGFSFGDDDVRERVRTGILAVRAHPGVTGVLRMQPDGNARKRPFLLRVERGRIVAVE